MKNVLFVCLVTLTVLAACNVKPKFTDVVVEGEDGITYTAHVIEPRVLVPDTGEIIPLLKTQITDGWLYNSKDWTKKDAYSTVAGIDYRQIVFGKVVEIIPAEHEHN